MERKGKAKGKKTLIGVVYREFKNWKEKGNMHVKTSTDRLRGWLNRHEKQLCDNREK